MRFTLMSDIHIDHRAWDWDIMKDVDPSLPLVVAGDIENDVRAGSRWIAECSARFPKLIWVAGNHDFYNLGFHRTRLVDWVLEEKFPYPRTVSEIYTHYQRFSESLGVHFLHRGSVTLDGITFVGATGWHDFRAGDPHTEENQKQAYLRYMNDSRHIQWGTEYIIDSIMEHATIDFNSIEHGVSEATTPVVVVTHHAPHRALLQKDPDPIWTSLNGSYANTMMESVRDSRIRAWCFGHTHVRQDREINGVRYINNARGYPGENPSWMPVEIEID